MFVTEVFKFHVFNFIRKMFLCFIICFLNTCRANQNHGSFFGYLINENPLLFNLLIDLFRFWQQTFTQVYLFFCCSLPHITFVWAVRFFAGWSSIVFRFNRILRRTLHKILFKVVLLLWTCIVKTICVSFSDLM